MRKTLTAAMAALTFGGAVAATAVPAQARDHDGRYYGGDYRRDNRGNEAGVAIAAGIVGLALGAALTSGGNSSSYGSYGYAQPYYGNSYYGGGYRTCTSRRWVYDRYLRRDVQVVSRYAC